MKAHILPFNQLGYEAGLRKGEETEKMVLEAFEKSKDPTPPWFIRIDRADYDQDWNKGIDFVVQSDVGNLFLQIKSSEYWASKFVSKQRREGHNQKRRGKKTYNPFIAVTFLVPGMTHEERCARIVRVLSRKRDKLLVIRNGFTVARPSLVRSS